MEIKPLHPSHLPLSLPLWCYTHPPSMCWRHELVLQQVIVALLPKVQELDELVVKLFESESLLVISKRDIS